MINRRKAITCLGALGSSLFIPLESFPSVQDKSKRFRFCLNTSTVSGCGSFNVLDYIEIAGQAGYDGIELWVDDVRKYLDSEGSTEAILKLLQEFHLKVENAIGFAPWLSGAEGLEQMQEDMQMMKSIGCKRIAAPPVGNGPGQLDLFKTGRQYEKLLELGRKTGVMPQLEFWGASDIFWHIGQAVMVACVSGDTDARILPDIFHMFKGDSDFNSLEMIQSDLVDVFHLNDYVSSISRKEQTDENRIYPGDGEAPIRKILNYLNKGRGEKVLSLELFNKTYWKEDALTVAKTGLQKMKRLVHEFEKNA